MEENRAKRWDRRTIDRYVEKGLVSPQDYKDFLKGLPDDANNAQFVQMDLHDAELSGEEVDDNDDEVDSDDDDDDDDDDAEGA